MLKIPCQSALSTQSVYTGGKHGLGEVMQTTLASHEKLRLQSALYGSTESGIINRQVLGGLLSASSP